MTSEREYEVVIVGAGQAGGPLATALGEARRSVALIERSHVGGTCINYGCTPTKTMVASARMAYLARRAELYGVRVGGVEVEMPRVRERTRGMVRSFREGSERQITESGNVELLRGEAHFTGACALDVRLDDGTTTRLRAEQVFLNTGCRPALPPVEGIGEVGALDSTSIMELDAVPEHLIASGGGYIGVEFAQMFRRFGSRVTIVQRGPRLLAREDPDIAEAVAELLREDGIEVLLRTEATCARRTGDGVELDVRGPEGERTVVGTHLLAATGRRPNTDALDLPAAGVETDERGYVQVNERLETTAPGVWALGDVTGGPAFTHISYDDYRIIRANLLDGGSRTTGDRPVPYCVFTDPELGRVGLTETEAREAGHEVRVARMPMSSVARALEQEEPRGVIKVVIDGATDRILGCAVLGVAGGEIMAMLEIAMLGDLPYTALRDGVFAHPTLAEGLNTLFASVEG